MKRSYIWKNSILLIFTLVSICCLFITILSTHNLPEISLGRPRHLTNSKLSTTKLGKFAEMMLEMLPEGLAFTVFIPSTEAFKRDLQLHVNDSFTAEEINNTYAILTRVLSFSAVPRTISSMSVPFGKEISYDSVSGFTLYISKSLDGMLVVNRIRSESVDIKRGNVVVHVMDGVIMDSEFEQSVLSDDSEQE